MKDIIEQGFLSAYSNVNLSQARSTVLQHSQNRYGYYDQEPTTVFVSHKHSDLADLKGLLGYLEQNYNVKVYIDSQDPSMPKKTSDETALIIRERIKQCDRFILLASNDAIESKWCNWELGYGDAQKFPNYIALFPLKQKFSSDASYKGSEYMTIYPYIVYRDGTEKYRNGEPIARGFYIKEYKTGFLTPLEDWFRR